VNPPRRLRPGERAALLGVLAAATLGLAVAPAPLGSPIRKLANYRADSRFPIFNSPEVSAPPLQRAGAIVPDSKGETYYIWTRPDPQLGHDLIGASLLWLLPARPVPASAEARWVLSWDAPTRLPPGVVAQTTYDLGGQRYLVRIR
jgi:hypothetical protein